MRVKSMKKKEIFWLPNDVKLEMLPCIPVDGLSSDKGDITEVFEFPELSQEEIDELLKTFEKIEKDIKEKYDVEE